MKNRRLISMLCAIAMSLTLVLPVSAADTNSHKIDALRFEPVCGDKAYHEMVANWLGYAYVNGELYIDLGCAWQCSGCNYVMITEGDVTLDPAIAIGKWAGFGYAFDLGPMELAYVFAEEWGECYNSNTMDGYKFVDF